MDMLHAYPVKCNANRHLYASCDLFNALIAPLIIRLKQETDKSLAHSGSTTQLSCAHAIEVFSRRLSILKCTLDWLRVTSLVQQRQQDKHLPACVLENSQLLQ